MKQILITGTTNGIGKTLLNCLINSGYQCSVINRRPTAERLPIAKEYICDLANLNAVQTLCTQLQQESYFGLINNAGSGKPMKLEELDADTIYHELQLNLVTPLLLIQALLPQMRLNNIGRIINVSSVAATMHIPLLMTYSASKAGLNSLTHSIAKYLKGTNITINAIAPGGINTKSSIHGRKEISRLLGLSTQKYQQNMIDCMGRKTLIAAEELFPFIKTILDDHQGVFNGQRINLAGLLNIY
jgi:3-oxoacyl-[acyl-carrier protein] reductase